MPDNQYPNAVGIDIAKKNGVREAVDNAASNLLLDDRELQRIPGYPGDRRINFGAELRIQTGSRAPIERRTLVYIFYSGRMVLNPHSAVPRVRRRNSSWLRGATCPDSISASRSRAIAIPPRSVSGSASQAVTSSRLSQASNAKRSRSRGGKRSNSSSSFSTVPIAQSVPALGHDSHPAIGAFGGPPAFGLKRAKESSAEPASQFCL